MSKKSLVLGLTLAGMLTFLLTTNAIAAKGTVLKYSQPIGHLFDPNRDEWHGENIPSDVDWGRLMNDPTGAPPLQPNWVIADDFQDDFDTPVVTVRWWGSYFPGTILQETNQAGQTITRPFMPGDEDGYVISFFSDEPDPDGDRNDPSAFSMPRDLLGTYLINFEDVRIFEPTNYFGWDDHPIFLYEADLWIGHLDHPLPGGPAQPDGFHQQSGEVYWISIMAEVGHKVEHQSNPTGGPDLWVDVPTGKTVLRNPDPIMDPNHPDYSAEAHFWGWHTSPIEFNDLAVMGNLRMPGQEWLYGNWNPIEPFHGLHDMAFELFTIPEPTGLSLCLLGMIAIGTSHRRR